jgi:hypothetical protein
MDQEKHVWPSPEFEPVVRALIAERNAIIEKITAAERQLELARKHGDIFELSGRRPQDVTQKLQQDISELERAKGGIRDRIWTLYSQEHGRYVKARDAVWVRVYSQDLQPIATKLNYLMDEFDRKISEFTALISDVHSDHGPSTAGEVTALDASAIAWNDLAKQAAAGANFLIPPEGSLRATIADSIQRNFKPHQRLEQTLNKFRTALALEPLKTKSAWATPEPKAPFKPLPPEHLSHWPGRIPE